MSPSAICVAKLATLMAWRSASPAPASSTVWQTVGPHREPVSERERAAVCDGQLCVLTARHNCLGPSFALIQNVPGEVSLKLKPSPESRIVRVGTENLKIQTECAANLA